ncbi:hypothetical protein V494_05121 [Pseudogymnoascus sp. VKM F-4513 (FW-928)]|nr:hypothetical protein V494_05121 [Pseudogymnoascus sp. VKM F-4513 (FW-928)]
MSSDALPIGTAAFAAALEPLPLSTLHLKAAELRNSLAHLEYSNAQLEPFARPPVGQEPDVVCVEAIAENVIVMERMRERLALLQQEAEKRGVGWGEFVGEDGIDLLGEPGESGPGRTAATGSPERELNAQEHEDLRALRGMLARRESGSTERASDDSTEAHSAWTDGTFQTGRITNGVLAMDNDITSVQGAMQSAGNNTTGTATNGANGRNGTNGTGGVNGANTARGGTLSDEELRRRLEERLTTEDDGSLHL